MESNIIVLDTETSKAGPGNYQFSPLSNLVFDIGFVIMCEDTYEIKYSYNALVEEVFNDSEIMSNFFFGEKAVAWYYKQAKSGQIPVKPARQIGEEIQKIVKEFDVDIVTAYNATFDVGAIKDTWRDLEAGLVFDFDEVIVWDLYHMACQALQYDENYAIAAVENNFLTDKGNVRATAEAVYAYIHNDFGFVEDHTALSDAQIEADILKWMLNNEKKNMSIYYDRASNNQAWRLVQNF